MRDKEWIDVTCPHCQAANNVFTEIGNKKSLHCCNHEEGCGKDFVLKIIVNLVLETFKVVEG